MACGDEQLGRFLALHCACRERAAEARRDVTLLRAAPCGVARRRAAPLASMAPIRPHDPRQPRPFGGALSVFPVRGLGSNPPCSYFARSERPAHSPSGRPCMQLHATKAETRRCHHHGLRTTSEDGRLRLMKLNMAAHGAVWQQRAERSHPTHQPTLLPSRPQPMALHASPMPRRLLIAAFLTIEPRLASPRLARTMDGDR